MAGKKSSDILYKLIHALTTEEKGYFKKFAKRQISKGNNYLQLFDAINNQKEFDEAPLKKRFIGYTDMKVYLKEIITDSLVLYHKTGHAHLQLFSMIEKIQVLLIKGFYTEAMRMLKKSLDESRKMELFSIERYLLRIEHRLTHQKLDIPEERFLYHEKYRKEMELSLARDSDLAEWELLADEWFAKAKNFGENQGLTTYEYIRQVKAMPASSTRSEMSKLNVLFALNFLKDESRQVYEIMQRQMKLATDFKNHADTSLPTVQMQRNQIKAAMDLQKWREVIPLAEEMMRTQATDLYAADIANTSGNVAKLYALFRTARFDEGVELIRRIDREMKAASVRLNDTSRLVHYQMHKVEFFLVTGNYIEAWRALDEIQVKRKPGVNKYLYTEWAICRLMAQFGMKHYALLKPMAVKHEKVFRKLEIMDNMYEILFNFFKSVTSANEKQLAKESAILLENYIREKSTGIHRVEEARTFVFWFNEIAGGLSYKEAVIKRQKEENTAQQRKAVRKKS